VGFVGLDQNAVEVQEEGRRRKKGSGHNHSFRDPLAPGKLAT
jgi:hypothetical protein